MALKRLYLIAYLILAPFESLAGVSHETCRVYNEHDSDVPSDVREIFAQVPSIPVRVCVRFGDWENATYRLILPPVRGPLGACQYVTSPIFKENGTWTHDPSTAHSYVARRTVFMMTSDGECPPHNDSHYIVTSDITEGVFIAATRFWEQISAGENLDKLLGSASPDIRSTIEFQSFMDALESGRQGPSSLKLVSLSQFNPDPVRITPHFSLTVNGPGNAWSVIVDFEDGRLRLLGIRSVLY